MVYSLSMLLTIGLCKNSSGLKNPMVRNSTISINSKNQVKSYTQIESAALDHCSENVLNKTNTKGSLSMLGSSWIKRLTF